MCHCRQGSQVAALVGSYARPFLPPVWSPPVCRSVVPMGEARINVQDVEQMAACAEVGRDVLP